MESGGADTEKEGEPMTVAEARKPSTPAQPLPDADSRGTMARGAMACGTLLGCSHATAELTLLGVLGLHLTPVDLILTLTSWAGLGWLAGVAIALISRVLPVLRGHTHLMLWVIYATVATRIFSQTGALSLPGAIALSFAATTGMWIVLRRRSDRLRNLATLVISFTLVATFFCQRQESSVAEASRFRFLLALYLPAGLLLAFLIASLRSRATPKPRPVPLIAVLIVGNFLLWFTVLPLNAKHHVLEFSHSESATESSSPNLLLVVLDTLRADHMDLFGYSRPTMPQVTKLVTEEFDVVTTSMATAPSSLPSHASMFTGLYSSSHGGHKPFIHDENPPPYAYFMRDDATTLSEALGWLGYHCAGISANFGVLCSYGLERGFHHYDVAPGSPFVAERLSWLRSCRWLLGKEPASVAERFLPESITRESCLFTHRQPPYRRAGEINDLAFEWIEQREQPDQPFFLFLNYFDAHDPYLPETEFDGKYVTEPDSLSWMGFPKKDYHKILAGDRTLPHEELQYLIGQYDAELSTLDREVLRLVNYLKERELYENTMIVILSDHGEAFLEHGFLRHSTSLYDNQISVPFLVKLPESSRSNPPPNVANLQFVDLFPTVMEVIGGPVPPDLQGSPWARDRDWAMAEVFCHSGEIETLRREMCAVARDSKKYIRSTTGQEELYDLASDPNEVKNLIASEPPFVEDARSLVDQRNEWLLDNLGTSEMDEALLDKLKELGYVK